MQCTSDAHIGSHHGTHIHTNLDGTLGIHWVCPVCGHGDSLASYIVAYNDDALMRAARAQIDAHICGVT